MIHRFENVQLSAICAAVPRESVEMNSRLNIFGQEESNRLIRNTGIKASRISRPEILSSDLCLAAAEQLLAEGKLDVSEIDALVFISTTPNYLMPPTSHLLHQRLGLSKEVLCFDLPLGCSGYIYGLLQSAMLIQSSIAKKVLLLVGETPTKAISKTDRSMVFLFGDAGSASILEKKVGYSIPINAFSDGNGFHHIIWPNSALRKNPELEKFLVMDGVEMFSFIGAEVPSSINKLLDFCSTSVSEMDFVVIHQANLMIIEYLRKKMKINPEKLLMSLESFGNTGSATIPLTIANERSKISALSKKQVLMSGFGIGLSWGNAIVDLTNTHISQIVEV